MNVRMFGSVSDYTRVCITASNDSLLICKTSHFQLCTRMHSWSVLRSENNQLYDIEELLVPVKTIAVNNLMFFILVESRTYCHCNLSC